MRANENIEQWLETHQLPSVDDINSELQLKADDTPKLLKDFLVRHYKSYDVDYLCNDVLHQLTRYLPNNDVICLATCLISNCDVSKDYYPDMLSFWVGECLKVFGSRPDAVSAFYAWRFLSFTCGLPNFAEINGEQCLIDVVNLGIERMNQKVTVLESTEIVRFFAVMLTKIPVMQNASEPIFFVINGFLLGHPEIEISLVESIIALAETQQQFLVLHPESALVVFLSNLTLSDLKQCESAFVQRYLLIVANTLITFSTPDLLTFIGVIDNFGLKQFYPLLRTTIQTLLNKGVPISSQVLKYIVTMADHFADIVLYQTVCLMIPFYPILVVSSIIDATFVDSCFQFLEDSDYFDEDALIAITLSDIAEKLFTQDPSSPVLSYIGDKFYEFANSFADIWANNDLAMQYFGAICSLAEFEMSQL